MANKTPVVDYSLKGDWVVVGHPDGSVLLPKSELSGVEQLLQGDVLSTAMGATEKQVRRYLKAWSYGDPRFDHRRHMVAYSVNLRMQTKPRSLEPKVLVGEFEITLWWWRSPEGDLVIEEQGREKIMVRSSDHKVHLDTEDIPKELIDRMIAATELYLES